MNAEDIGDGGTQEDQGYNIPPSNNDPLAVTGTFDLVISILQDYGWLLLAIVVVGYFLKSKLEPKLDRVRQTLDDRRERRNYDENAVMQREEARMAAIQRMQEQHDAKSAKHAEVMKEREEQKRQQKLEDWERHQEGRGYRSKYRPPAESSAGPSTSSSSSSSSSASSSSKKKNPYKNNDYNPLTGTSSSGGGGGMCYRPPRRGGGGGGG